jgi:hypothetical protein
MIFASKTPRDLNHDPEPWVNAAPDFERGSEADFEEWQPRHGKVFDPRPEFDHAQQNEPNPILTTLRLNSNAPREDGWDARIAALYFLEGVGIDNVEREQATPEHVEHARRVLTRLAYRFPSP